MDRSVPRPRSHGESAISTEDGPGTEEEVREDSKGINFRTEEGLLRE